MSPPLPDTGTSPPGEVPAQGSVDGGVQLSVTGGQQGLHPVLDELEGDVRMGQGQMLHEAVHRRSLRTVLAHELQPGGGVVKQVPDRDGGALRRTGGLHCAGHTALQMEGGSLRRAGLAGEDVHPADGGDGGQGLAPEPQSTDLPQVLLRPQLGGGVAQEGGGGVPPARCRSRCPSPGSCPCRPGGSPPPRQSCRRRRRFPPAPSPRWRAAPRPHRRRSGPLRGTPVR